MKGFATAVVLLTITIVAAEELQSVKDENSVQSDSTDVEEGRIRHHHILPFYGGLLGLGGLGGLNALAVLFAIKVKIVVVAALIGLSIYYYSKYFKKGGCFGETIFPYEAYSSHGPTGYSNHGFTSDHGPPSGFSSYTGPDPYSAYSDIHPDISTLDLHHHATGFDDHHHSSGFDHHSGFDDHHHDSGFDDHDSGFAEHPPSSFNGHDQIMANNNAAIGGSASGGQVGGTGASPVPAPPTQTGGSSSSVSAPYRRISIQKRQINQNILENINWGEIAFQFLGVDSNGCRRRFVCELDFRAQRNPFTRIAFSFIGRDFFDQYRDLSPHGKRPAKYSDCAVMYRQCAAAGAYDNVNDNKTEDNEDEDDEEETTDDAIEDSVTEVTEAAFNDINDEKTEKDSGRQMTSNSNQQPLGRIILKRAEK